MRDGFGQFCPVALACETLTQKWTLLIVRELCAGATRFSDIRRGVPRISATLLKERLDTLERAGVVGRRTGKSGAHQYMLTEAGEDLKPVLASVGAWGQRWAREIEARDLDPGWLVWAMHRRLNTSAMPTGRTVIEIVFTDAPASARRFWLVHNNGDVDVCVKRPGFDVDITLSGKTIVLAEIWRGIRSLPHVIKAGDIVVEGKPAMRRALPGWLLLSVYAPIKRGTR
jgi:DNA-binding HxlR family transcriptional regulator